MVIRPVLALLAILGAGCADISLRDTSKAASDLTKPLRLGMTPTQVHAALGKPEYAERAKTWLGFKTDQVQEVYARGVPSKHLYIEPVVIACGNRNGIYDADDGYMILVRYNSDFRVAAFEVVPSWTHGQEPDAPTLPIPQ